ncbi:MAG TPA: 50S ribosomal protein L5 [Patescibacteria group bacterium]|nr:50S ribosomal protein L5 [Patescibacteria group bacterium]
MERLQEQYTKEIVPKLREKFSHKNIAQVPKLQKIVINVGVGKLNKESKLIDSIFEDLKKITGQQPVKTYARKSISGFKLREGQLVGLTVTLRGFRMYAFLDKLINVALPRVRDFRGIAATGFDGRGSFSLGLREQLVFPEISADALETPFGLQITIVSNAGADEPMREILSAYKFPLKTE